MTTDSTTGGFVVPSAEPEYDDPLEDQLHSTLFGVLGDIPEDLIRPRWQPNPPNQPGFTENWLAFGIVSTDPDVNAAETHVDAEGGGYSIVARDEVLNVQLSFYGPRAAAYDARLRAGLTLAQNRQGLRDVGVTVVRMQPPVSVPALVKQTWVPRIDSTLVLRRRTEHTFPVRSLVQLASQSTLDNEHYLTSLSPLPNH